MRLRRQKRAPFLRQRVGFSRLTVPRVAVCCGGYAAARGGYAAAHAPCAPGELHAGGGSTAAEFGWVVARSSGARTVWMGGTLAQELGARMEFGWVAGPQLPQALLRVASTIT